MFVTHLIVPEGCDSHPGPSPASRGERGVRPPAQSPLRLEPYVPPKPLPEITDDDVHLVRWLALT